MTRISLVDKKGNSTGMSMWIKPKNLGGIRVVPAAEIGTRPFTEISDPVSGYVLRCSETPEQITEGLEHYEKQKDEEARALRDKNSRK